MDKKNKESSTVAKILCAAEDIFVEKGFSGTSINDIASKAKIHKSLIYHHFQNKEDLWKTVKERLLQAHMGKSLNEVAFPMTSFQAFLESFVSLRFDFYDQNPAIARLICWQRLEKETDELKGIKGKMFISLISQIKEFQRRGEIQQDLDPEMINYLIVSISSLPFTDRPKFFEGTQAKQNKKKMLKMIVKSLHSAFTP